MKEKNFLIKEENMETTVPGVYVAGDVTGVEEASTAMEEGNLAGLAIGLGALGSALGMGNAAGHALEAGARQPEIFGKIQTLLLTAIVFIESVCIYALVVALLLIFVV